MDQFSAPIGAILENPKPVGRDFGLLKVRSLKVKSSQMPINEFKTTQLSFDRMTNQQLIEIINSKDIQRKRELSKWFFEKNGMYARAVRYLSDIYRFDFMIYPNLDLEDDLPEAEQKKILKAFNLVLEHFDNSAIQLLCRKWTIAVCIEGCYYGYLCDDVGDKMVVQDLPADFCRSRFLHRGLPLVEFNVQYFDKITSDAKTRDKLLRLFPEEIQKGYRDYKNNKLQAETMGDTAGWIMLSPIHAFKFNFNSNDVPPFLSAIPSLLELDEVQDLEKEKLLQEIQKILIQTFELDKNGQIPFTMPELQRLNQNAIDMVGDAVGVSVLSTIANVHLEDLKSTGSHESESKIETAENDVYNNLGISTNLFNTDGNLALDKSVIIDEAFAKPMLLAFEQFFNDYISQKFNKKAIKFRMKMLTTTIFNFKDISDKYKDLTKLGFSRFLPMVALGHTQKEVISMAKLEQQIMQLDAYMLPPFSSNTMSSDTWSNIKEQQSAIIAGRKVNQQINGVPAGAGKTAAPSSKGTGGSGSSNGGGRPAKPDDKKSDKTIANQASK